MEYLSLKRSVNKWLMFFAFCICSQNTFASNTGGGDLPFSNAMETLQKAISGPFLMAAAIIMIVVTCLMLAFGEWGDGFKKVINMVLWLSIAFAASSFISSMFATGATF